MIRNSGNSHVDQESIYQCIALLGTTKKLTNEIFANGGLVEEVIVSDHTVIEGNSRLAAYRQLHAKYPNDEKWLTIPAKILDENIDRESVEFLLGTYHVNGKSSWPAFEKAAFISRALEQGASLDDLARDFGQGKILLSAAAKAYDAMIEYLLPLYSNEDCENAYDCISHRYSYFEALFRVRGISRERKKPEFLSSFAYWVFSGAFEKAAYVRDLPAILANAEAKLVFDQCMLSLPSEAYERAMEALNSQKACNSQRQLSKMIRELDNALNETTLNFSAYGDPAIKLSTLEKMRIKRIVKNLETYLS